MTKKLEDILNLPNVKEAFKEVDKKEQAKANKEQTGKVMKNVDPKTAEALKKSYAQSRPNPATLRTLKNYGSMLNARGLERHEQRTNYTPPKSSSFYIGGMSPDEVKRKGGVYYEVGAPVDDGSVEIDLSYSAPRSSLGDPRFDNKVQEAIWRLKNNK